MPRNKKSVPEATEIAFIEPPAPDENSIPEQKVHFALPVRFGAVPVDEAPLGWEVEMGRREPKETRFQHAYPTIRLPFQEVQRIEFGHNAQFLAQNKNDLKLRELFPTGANRIFFGDNLHVMRQLPGASIDLIYIDPPFFSGRDYNMIFGDKNEKRSFSDIWDGGMPGYLVWLNARLWEMKRLLKPTGSIFVHLDWHASHYVKVEMDKIFEADNFRNELIWYYEGGGGRAKNHFNRKHDTILFYSKGGDYKYNIDNVRVAYKETSMYSFYGTTHHKVGKHYAPDREKGKNPDDVWVMNILNPTAKERIGYPTQKPLEVVQRIIDVATDKGDVVADFFMGGGTTLVAAIGLRTEIGAPLQATKYSVVEPRRFIGCDQSRIAVAITADRISRVMEEKIGALFPVPDFTVEHWGIYEVPRLETYNEEKFREFVVTAFGGRPESISPAIHGVRYGIPLYVGEPSRRSRILKDDVARFAKAVYEERRANHGVMLGWNFGLDARKAADILAARENKRIDFVRLSLVRLEDDEFREHIINKNKDYGAMFSFIQPPEVRVAIRRVRPLSYEFDVSESVSLNKDGIIANVQWDFSYKEGRFTSTQGYTFLRDKDRPILIVEYEFPKPDTYTIACSVQDDQGGERTVVQTIEVE